MSQLVLGIIVKKSSKERTEENKNVVQEETSLIYLNKIRYNRKNSHEYWLEVSHLRTKLSVRLFSACAVMLTNHLSSSLHNTRFKRE